MDTLNKLAEYFNVPKDYLLGSTDDINNIEQVYNALDDDSELLEFWDMLEDSEGL